MVQFCLRRVGACLFRFRFVFLLGREDGGVFACLSHFIVLSLCVFVVLYVFFSWGRFSKSSPAAVASCSVEVDAAPSGPCRG